MCSIVQWLVLKTLQIYSLTSAMDEAGTETSV